MLVALYWDSYFDAVPKPEPISWVEYKKHMGPAENVVVRKDGARNWIIGVRVNLRSGNNIEQQIPEANFLRTRDHLFRALQSLLLKYHADLKRTTVTLKLPKPPQIRSLGAVPWERECKVWIRIHHAQTFKEWRVAYQKEWKQHWLSLSAANSTNQRSHGP